jgi:hypothetical protein
MAGRRGGGPRLDGAQDLAADAFGQSRLSPAQVRVLEKRFFMHGASVFFIIIIIFRKWAGWRRGL